MAASTPAINARTVFSVLAVFNDAVIKTTHNSNHHLLNID